MGIMHNKLKRRIGRGNSKLSHSRSQYKVSYLNSIPFKIEKLSIPKFIQ